MHVIEFTYVMPGTVQALSLLFLMQQVSNTTPRNLASCPKSQNYEWEGQNLNTGFLTLSLVFVLLLYTTSKNNS